MFAKPASGWADMTQTAKLTASDGAEDAWFGKSVSISGDTVVVGAIYAPPAGAAYVFTKPGSGWANMTETGKLTVFVNAVSGIFGDSVSISGNTVVVGDRLATVSEVLSQGAAYSFTKPASGWTTMTETDLIIDPAGAADFQFGNSVSISGNMVVVGEWSGGISDQGAAYVFATSVVASPTVTGISPSQGPLAGGTPVTITGTDFTGATAVDFGTVAASSFTVDSATQITATSPAGTGKVDVTVVTAKGASATSAADQFTYVANLRPVVVLPSLPSSPQSGNISVPYRLTDVESDTCSILVEYSPDGGATWYAATPGTGGDGTTGLTSSDSVYGMDHVYAWDSAADIVNTINSNVEIRITASDAGGAGAAATSDTFTVKNANLRPVVTINQAFGQADPTAGWPIYFTVVFSEPVSDFATGDVTITGTAGAGEGIVTGSGTTYTVEVPEPVRIALAGVKFSGTVVANIAAGVAHDAVGNPNDASTSTDNTVVYDDGPKISDVVVVEASSPANGILESTDSLAMTWNVSNPVVDPFFWLDIRASVSVDGNPCGSQMVVVGTPGGATCYYPIGAWPVGNHTYEIEVIDGLGAISNYGGQFTVVDQEPTDVALSNDSVPENQPLGTVVGVLSGTDPDAGQSATLTFSLVSGYGDDALFSIDPLTKQLKTAAVFDYESKSSYSIEVRATDSGSPALTYDEVLPPISVTDVNEPPTDVALSNASVPENQPLGTVVGVLSGTDPDAGQSATLTFSLVSGYGDDALFSIDPLTKQLKTAAVFDYESKSSYSIEVRATDSGSPALTYDEVLPPISVTDVNEPPTVIVPTPAGTQTGHVTITYSLFDPDSDTCGIVVKFADGSKNPDGSLKWNIAKAVSGLGDGTYGLVSSPTGVSHTFVWDGGSDLANTCNSLVEIRITPSDPGGDGAIGATGNFTAANHSQGAPIVGSVVVAETAAPKNGVLESNEGLKITWAATGSNPISKQTMRVDDTPVASTSSYQILGPYGGQYYTCQIAARTAGIHTYAITATDSKGFSFTYTSSFNVAAPVLPYVGSVVVAEAATPRNGILENNEKLRITWAASSSNGVATQTMTVDGKAITPINGPYGAYYSCAIGMWSAGAHRYVITTTDAKGGTFNSTGTFSVVASSVATLAISSIVVAEAAVPKNGTLESADQLRITWAATSQSTVASQSITIDGRRITTISGPYGHLYYSCSIGAWLTGTHTYAITATNASGFSSTSSGVFNVAASASTPVTVGSVVVAEAAAPRDGSLQLTEALVITWAAESSNKIASQAVTIDGRSVSPIYGPYGGLYYSCPIGAWSAGSHAYTITATDSKGISATSSGTFLVVDVPASSSANAASVTATERAGLLAAVMREMDDSGGCDDVLLDDLIGARPIR